MPCRLTSRRMLRRCGQRPVACSSHVPSRRRSPASNCSNGSSARATIRLGSTSGIATALSGRSAALITEGRVTQGSPSASSGGPSPVRTPGTEAAGPPRCSRRAGGSSPAPASPNTASNASSKAARSSTRFTNVSRAAQYNPVRERGSRCRSACTNRLGPLAATVTPAPRIRATSPTAKAARSTPGSSSGAVIGGDAMTYPAGTPAAAPARPAPPGRTSSWLRRRPVRAGRSAAAPLR